MKNIKGITLIALVITIIVLLILAGVVITGLTQAGLLENAKQAKNATENAQKYENGELEEYNSKINQLVGGRNYITEGELLFEKTCNIDGKKNITYTSTEEGVVLAIISGASRNVNQYIGINCTSTATINLVNTFNSNWGNNDGRGWSCIRTSIYLIPNIVKGDTITAIGEEYTGFPIFMMQVIKLK